MNDKITSAHDEIIKRVNNALGELATLMEQGSADNCYPWIVFSLDDTEYAINARYVLHVAALHELVPFSSAPAYCSGVIWDRNGIIHLLDLRVLLGRGDYLSAAAKKNSGLSMIIIIEPDGKRRGIIVDRIIVLEYGNTLIDAPANEDDIHSGYVKGALKYDSQKDPAFIISPESFNALEFEDQNAKINWKGYIDMEMKADDH